MKNLIMLSAAVAFLATMTGCAIVSAKSGTSSYLGFAVGEKASSGIAGLAIVEGEKEGDVIYKSVGVDKAGSSSESKFIESLGKVLIMGISSYASNATNHAAQDNTCTTGNCGE